ncbi:MAG: DUF1566 domain-containing protein [Nitrospinae bacterium]|nr:DUF1566 domain-containing protein [Nitrospinota bacterium]
MVKPRTGQSVVAVYSSTADVWTLAKLPDTGQTIAPFSPSYKTDGDCTINPPSDTDWRYSNIRELPSLLDFSKSTEPWIDAEYFPKAHAARYASSTFDPEDPYSAYLASIFGSDTSQYIRCVRGDGQ